MFLTPAELRELTGRQHADAQIAALKREDWPFVLDADGRPKVAREVYEARVWGRDRPAVPVRKPSKVRLDLVR